MMKEEAQNRPGDRRKDERLSKIFKMHYQAIENLGEKSPYQEGVVVDISHSGLRFLSPHPFGVGTELLIVLEFPGWLEANGPADETRDEEMGALQAIGKIVRVAASSTRPGKYEIGVQFAEKVEAKEI